MIADLAAELAWRHFLERLTPEQESALKGWREVVKKMGKGSGRSKKLERLRRQARQYIDVCRDVIPAWIMPRHLVADMVTPQPGRFDTVIVDEASQMGINGLFTFYIGKRLVVVGDDEQITPSDVGVRDEAVVELIRKHVPDISHSHTFERGSSVYSNAKIRYGKAVTLKEHFRCMPEIIQFSNDLCYAGHGTPLDPLRSFTGERLDPLKPVRVAGGLREGAANNAVNREEARQIVAQIKQCIDHPAYTGKSIGVISLIGKRQAKEIESLVLGSIDPEVVEERGILCGDSYSFQGDERDVIFLSMVASRGETRISAQTSQAAVQRYNVAASRARDQLWLFYSLDLEDLKPECLRFRLIQHVREPARTVADEAEQEFDSEFERDVFRAIAERGYHARTQVKVGSHAYRIDIVVEGLAGRLAVECDGERWHGPERWEADMARQRDLERVGWEFFRVRGSDYFRDPHASLLPLWKLLDERGIEPAAPCDIATSDAEAQVAGRRFTQTLESGAGLIEVEPVAVHSAPADPVAAVPAIAEPEPAAETPLNASEASSPATDSCGVSQSVAESESRREPVAESPEAGEPIVSSSRNDQAAEGGGAVAASDGAAPVGGGSPADAWGPPDEGFVEASPPMREPTAPDAAPLLGESAASGPASMATEPLQSVPANAEESAPGGSSAFVRGEVHSNSVGFLVAVPSIGDFQMPDPRDAKVRVVCEGLAKIVRRRGPIPRVALFHLYKERAGIRRMGHKIEEILSRALSVAETERLVEVRSEEHGATQVRVVRVSGSAPVFLRELRGRGFDEVPLSEWAAHLAREAGGAAFVPNEDREGLIRRLLSGVGWSLTQKRRPTLEAAYEMAAEQSGG